MTVKVSAAALASPVKVAWVAVRGSVSGHMTARYARRQLLYVTRLALDHDGRLGAQTALIARFHSAPQPAQ